MILVFSLVLSHPRHAALAYYRNFSIPLATTRCYILSIKSWTIHHAFLAPSTMIKASMNSCQEGTTRSPESGEQEAPLTLLIVVEIDGRFDQAGLAHNQLQTGACPTLVTGMAMLIAQMQSLTTLPDLVLSLSR